MKSVPFSENHGRKKYRKHYKLIQFHLLSCLFTIALYTLGTAKEMITPATIPITIAIEVRCTGKCLDLVSADSTR